MNYRTLSKDLKHLGAHGVTLSLDEQMKVNMAIMQCIVAKHQYEDVQLWGKIEGK